jgi:hypothetical protein
MRMRSIDPTNRHQALKADLDEVMRKHGEHLTAQEILAVAAQVVGMVVAYQDATKMTTESCMEIVLRNIEIGNHVAIESMGITPAAGHA